MHLASITGWAFREIMDEVPFSAGLQLIDADLASKGIERIYVNASPNFDVLAQIDAAFAAVKS